MAVLGSVVWEGLPEECNTVAETYRIWSEPNEDVDKRIPVREIECVKASSGNELSVLNNTEITVAKAVRA